MDRPVDVLGVPMDLGADRRGVDMGPSAIRYGGLTPQLEALGLECRDCGDLTVPRAEEQESKESPDIEGQAKFLDETRAVCTNLAERVNEISEAGHFPLVLGGDHSIAIGTVNGVADENTGILWLDAHGDFNTPATTPSGNVHGMPLAAILGKGVFADMDWAHAPEIHESNVAMIGLRSLDANETEMIQESDVHAYTMTDIDEYGITAIVRDALGEITATTDQLSVSLDLDLLDPSEAPGVGTPVRGGVSYREAHAAMELLHTEADTELCALEIVEVNPILDKHNNTAELACELAASALGDKIL